MGREEFKYLGQIGIIRRLNGACPSLLVNSGDSLSLFYFILFFFGLDQLRQGIQPPCPYQVHGKGYLLLPHVDTWMQNLCSMVIPSQN